MGRGYSISTRYVLSLLWIFAGMIGVSGCATPLVSFESSLPGGTSFDRALMSYVQGSLDTSLTELRNHQASFPGDVRAQILRVAILREQGEDGVFVDAVDRDERLSEGLTPQQLLLRTQERNPEIQQRLLDIIRARGKWREAELSFTPEFFALTRFHPGGFFIRLTQDILGGLIERPLRMHQAEAGILEAVARYAQTHQKVQRRMAHAYFSLLEAQESVDIIQSAIDVAQEHRRVGSILADEGVISPRRAAAIQEELLDLQQQLEVRQGQVTVAQATVRGVLDVSHDSTVSLQSQHLLLPPVGTVDLAIAEAFQGRAELHVVQAQLQQREWAQDANRWMLPKFNLRTTYGETTDEGKGDFLDGFSIGVSGEVPLLLWPLRKAQSDQEQAFIDRLKLEMERVRAEIMIETVEAYERVRVAQAGLHQHQVRTQARYAEWQRLHHQMDEGYNASQHDVLAARVEHLKSQLRQVTQQYEAQLSMLAWYGVNGAPIDHVKFIDLHESTQTLPEQIGDPRLMKRGLWVWDSDSISSPNQSEFFLSFLRAHHIQTVFLFVTPDLLRNHRDEMQNFLHAAHGEGLKVHALNGEPGWIFEEQRSLAQEFMSSIGAYHGKVHPDERFDALHFDVEPHALDDWNSPRQGLLVQQYLKFLEWVTPHAAATKLPAVFDIPYWYDTIEVEGHTLLQSVWEKADQVTIMAYRNSAAKVLESIQQEMELLQTNSRPVWVGLSAEPTFLPRASSTQSMDVHFEAMVQEVESHVLILGDSIGVSIHDYAHYREMMLLPHNDEPFLRTGALAQERSND